MARHRAAVARVGRWLDLADRRSLIAAVARAAVRVATDDYEAVEGPW
jgi:hypothetical protein